MADVGRKLIGQFARCLAEEIVQPHSGPVEPAPLPAATPPEEVAAPAESALPPDADASRHRRLLRPPHLHRQRHRAR